MKNGKNNRSALSYMNKVVGKKRWYVVVLALLQAYIGCAGVVLALLLRSMIDYAVDGNREQMVIFAVILVVFIIVTHLVQVLSRYLEELSRSTLENAFKKKLFSAILNKNYESVTSVHSGEWLNRMTSDVVVVADGITQLIPGLVGMGVKLIAALVVLIALEPRFGYILIPAGIVVVIFTYAFRKVLKRLHKQVQEADGKLRIFLSERIGSLLVIHSFSKEENSLEGAEECMNEHKKMRMIRNHFSNFCNFAFGALIDGAYIAGAIFCCYGLLSQTISYGTMTAILQLVSQVQSPMANISGYLPKYYAVIASCERLMEVEEFADDCTEKALSHDEILAFYGDEFSGIKLENLCFSYSAAKGLTSAAEIGRNVEVLENLSICINRGDYVAVAGPSGCGKSTVLKLMMCLYSPNDGKQYLCRRNGEQTELTSGYRGLFAYVPQGNQLLSGSIREIITFGDKSQMQDDEKIHEALKISCAESFVVELEDGLDTVLGEHGMGLSEGQMQRIAIARAVFSENPILMLDEATSSLDENTEKQLLSNLRSMTDRTVIIVTHRMAVLSICDQCIHMNPEGVRVEQIK